MSTATKTLEAPPLPEVHCCPYREIKQLRKALNEPYKDSKQEDEIRARGRTAEQSQRAHLEEQFKKQHEAFNHLLADLNTEWVGSESQLFGSREIAFLEGPSLTEWYRQGIELEKIRELHAQLEAKIKARLQD